MRKEKKEKMFDMPVYAWLGGRYMDNKLCHVSVLRIRNGFGHVCMHIEWGDGTVAWLGHSFKL